MPRLSLSVCRFIADDGHCSEHLTRDLMLEVNPLYNALKDMQARTDVLRGYL
jgi:hypothetical protein